MAQQHISMRGNVVDFNKLRMQNAEKPALGNASMNARGDILSQEGVVIKTQEQVEQEWAARMAEQHEVTRSVNIKDQAAMSAAAGVAAPVAHPETKTTNTSAPATKEYQAPPGLQPKVVDLADKDFDPESTPKSRRKIVESD